MAEYRGIRVRRNSTFAERVAFHTVADPSGCLLWTSSKNAKGYGIISWRGKNHIAHRLVWINAFGPIFPAELDVLHECDVPACVNIDHLWLGTNDDNVADKVAKGRTGKEKRQGALNVMAKITDDQAREILALPKWKKKRGVRVVDDLCERFGISKAVFFRIRSGKSWKHLHTEVAPNP